KTTGGYNRSSGYDISVGAYDKNGNITGLWRNNGTGRIDDLTYSYHNNGVSNRLRKVEDPSGTEGFVNGANTATEYEYDVNGNMTSDANKGITSITYNHLNLPTSVTITGGNISYIYDATGVKLKKTVSTGKVTEYAGNYIYENNQLQFFSHAEGYVTPSGSGGYDYVYQYKDHLGNIRLSYQDADNNGSIATNEIVEESNYYPFGLKQKGYNNVVSPDGNALAQQWKFGGKQYQEELDLNWYDVTARNYDPALGRWMNIDPLAEKMRRHSPYNYAFDNPIYFIDYDGMMPSGSCCGPIVPSPLGWAVKAAAAIGSFLGMDPINVEGSGSDRSSSNGYEYVTEDGQPSGDPSTVTKTDGTVEEVDVTGLEPLMTVAGGKKASRGNGMTNAKNPAKKNAASSFADGAESASDVSNSVDSVDNVPDGGGSMETSNKSEPDTTFITKKAGTITTVVNSNSQVTSFGNIENVEVTVPKSKVDSVNRASEQSLQSQGEQMDNNNQRLLDSLNLKL
ncbi:hypothetical protein OOZ15_19460, partial [Galbibacter sp. EGI 63066]|uniref:RHS repeat domain-containing protein n=1 Tax=Galbibacter sp. EGI 63066 TaxID=2993559 RepID=UPI002B05F900